MKRILIDTNIVLDIAFKRQPFFNAAQEILLLIESNPDKLKAYLSATSVTDIYYIVSRKTGKQKALEFLKDILLIFEIADVDREIIDGALSSGLKDFEDAVQQQCAIKNEMQIILTRNKKDFTGTVLNVFTPDEFLESHRE